jgi:ankyrin repeat protein
MNLPCINSTLPCLRNLTNTNRLLSCSTNSKSISSSSSSNKSKELNPLPILIQLCIYPDEKYAYRTMRLLLSSRYHYSPNVYDEFGCNVIMYSLRYQRYRLFQFLLNDLSSNLNLQAKDRDGNTILHYAILYSGNDTRIIEKLIEKYQKFAIKIDQRNKFGFTPLLFGKKIRNISNLSNRLFDYLAAFCGRYDFVLTLLTKTDASPFVRDCIQLKSIFDYIEIDLKHQKY